MIARKPAIVLVGVAAVAAYLLCNNHVQSQSHNAQYKLGGAFIGTGQAGLWSGIQSPLDPSGKTAIVRVAGIAMPGFAPLLQALDANSFGELVGQEEMISRDTARYNTFGYAIKNGVEVKAILQMTGTVQFQGPDAYIVLYTINVFAASSDADKDGFPDAGATPILPPIQGRDFAKRVTL